MIKRVLHRVVSHPRIYDQVQVVAGVRSVFRRLADQITPLDNNRVLVLDLAGGTGLWRNLWPFALTYVCLDIDLLKLRGFRSKQIQGNALCADALNVPLSNKSVDVITCIGVSHHFTADNFEQLLQESVRVLKDTGIFVFLDPVWQPGNLIGHLLWRFDQGSYPHSAKQLRFVISNYYRIVHEEEFSVYHHYFFCRGVKSSKHLSVP
jgi:SAM-dependent methyltransferase